MYVVWILVVAADITIANFFRLSTVYSQMQIIVACVFVFFCNCCIKCRVALITYVCNFFFYQTDGEGMGYCPDVLSHCRSHVQYVWFNCDFKNIKWVFLIFNFQLRASFEKKIPIWCNVNIPFAIPYLSFIFGISGWFIQKESRVFLFSFSNCCWSKNNLKLRICMC